MKYYLEMRLARVLLIRFSFVAGHVRLFVSPEDEIAAGSVDVVAITVYGLRGARSSTIRPIGLVGSNIIQDGAKERRQIDLQPTVTRLRQQGWAQSRLGTCCRCESCAAAPWRGDVDTTRSSARGFCCDAASIAWVRKSQISPISE
jgi:hypothetical protein